MVNIVKTIIGSVERHIVGLVGILIASKAVTYVLPVYEYVTPFDYHVTTVVVAGILYITKDVLTGAPDECES